MAIPVCQSRPSGLTSNRGKKKRGRQSNLDRDSVHLAAGRLKIKVFFVPVLNFLHSELKNLFFQSRWRIRFDFKPRSPEKLIVSKTLLREADPKIEIIGKSNNVNTLVRFNKLALQCTGIERTDFVAQRNGCKCLCIASKRNCGHFYRLLSLCEWRSI